jgi:hypothetical protein
MTISGVNAIGFFVSSFNANCHQSTVHWNPVLSFCIMQIVFSRGFFSQFLYRKV